MSRLIKQFKHMWANVWFRSLLEVIVVALAAALMLLFLQSTEQGMQMLEQVKQLMGYPTKV